MVTWSELPDLGAVGLLAAAFASVARRNQTHVSKTWLTGWLMIALHFAALLFQDAPGGWGIFAGIVALAALTWAGVLFMWASVPHRKEPSGIWMLIALLFVNTIYLSLSVAAPHATWILDAAAALFGLLPLVVALSCLKHFVSPLRWAIVGLYSALSLFVLTFQHRAGNGDELAQNAVLFTVYFGCCIHFFFAYRRATAGAFITIAGFFAWASVFVIGPWILAYMPRVVVEGEVWNLPKFLVAIGMILLLLEDQIEHNEYLALHDYLTGLPNRRLYQDRLTGALERARRFRSQLAVLVIDLDSFKHVNDTLGHHVGDKVLQRVAALFATRVRRSDTVARTGGDEFSIVLEEPTSRGEALLVGRSLLELLTEPLELGEHSVLIGASVGIAIFPEDAHEMEELCIAADLRMYEAKNKSHEAMQRDAEPKPPARALPNKRSAAGLQLVE